MKFLAVTLVSLVFVFSGVYLTSQQIRYKPWVKPGQEAEHVVFMETVAKLKEESKVDENSGEIAARPKPKLRCDKTFIDFGTLPPFFDAEYIFTLFNDGDADLHISSAGSSCVCTQTDLGTTKIAPGESHDVKLKWFTRPSDRNFLNSVKIISNDPSRPELILEVGGVVDTLVATFPGTVEIDALETESTASGSFVVYSSVWKSINVARIETSDPSVEVTEDASGDISLPTNSSRIESAKKFRVQVSEPGLFVLRIYVLPNEEWLQIHADQASNFQVADDGTWMIEVNVGVTTLKTLSLYSPWIRDANLKIIDLGKHFAGKELKQDFVILARVRGKKLPTSFDAQLEGLENVAVRVEPGDRPSDFRVVIHANGIMKPMVRDDFNPAILRLKAEGIPEGELEFQVHIDVLEKSR